MEELGSIIITGIGDTPECFYITYLAKLRHIVILLNLVVCLLDERLFSFKKPDLKTSISKLFNTPEKSAITIKWIPKPRTVSNSSPKMILIETVIFLIDIMYIDDKAALRVVNSAADQVQLSKHPSEDLSVWLITKQLIWPRNILALGTL